MTSPPSRSVCTKGDGDDLAFVGGAPHLRPRPHRPVSPPRGFLILFPLPFSFCVCSPLSPLFTFAIAPRRERDILAALWWTSLAGVGTMGMMARGDRIRRRADLSSRSVRVPSLHVFAAP